MSHSSPLLALPFIQPSQAQKHVTHNEALRILDAVVQLRVLSFGALTPPGAPAAGDVHALGAGATGEWAGQDGRLALWDGTGWAFIAPAEGWLAWDAAAGEPRVLTDGAWRPLAPSLQDLAGLGVNAESDATNRMVVASPATLLTHEGAGHQVKVNKATAADTASLVFQSGFTGHAEMGLVGGLDFALKVGDGGEWREAIRVARGTGRVALPRGATVDGTLTGTAVQAGPTDATPGRVLTTGAYGLGGLLPTIGNAAATDASLVPGLYAYDTAAGSSGGPAGVLRGSLLHTRRAAGGGETQALVVEAGNQAASPGLAFSRSRGTGAWSPWLCGHVVESGSTGSGRYVRHQDGTQTCWHTIGDDGAAWTTASGALYLRNSPLDWTFPAAFAAAPVVTGSVRRAESGIWGVAVRSIAAGSVAVFPWASVPRSAGESKEVALIAVGRWY